MQVFTCMSSPPGRTGKANAHAADAAVALSVTWRRVVTRMQSNGEGNRTQLACDRQGRLATMQRGRDWRGQEAPADAPGPFLFYLREDHMGYKHRDYKHLAAFLLALAGAAPAAWAGECETNFKKTGNLFTGT